MIHLDGVYRLPALLNALPPEQAAALNEILNARVTGNTAADYENVRADIGPAVGVPAPHIATDSSDHS